MSRDCINPFAALTVVWLLTLLSSKAVAEQIIIAADEWCPYNCSPNSEYPGYMVEIAIEAFQIQHSDHTVIYQQVPWTRAIKLAHEGKVQGIIGAIKSEAEGLHIPKQEQGLMHAQFFGHHQGKWHFKGTKSLLHENVIVGAISGYDYEENIAKTMKVKPDKFYFSHGEKALPKLIQMVNHNRLTALIEDEAVFWFNVLKLGYNSSEFRVAGEISEPQALYIAFGRKDHAETLDLGMGQLRQSGKLAEILAKYNLKDWR